jgi:serine/threonine protein phosphatase PrpC
MVAIFAAHTSMAQGSIRVQRVGSKDFQCAVAETQGTRVSHEDAHSMSCAEGSADFWVLDGHRGAGAARYGAVALAEEIGQTVKNGKLPSNSRVQQGFKTVDNQLRKNFKKDTAESKSGSTAVGVLAVKEANGSYSIKLLNCGDSRAVVVKGPNKDNEEPNMARPEKSVLLESADHKPSNPIEKARIKAAGGRVTKDKHCARLDGKLSVSRGLGDFEFKADKDRTAAEQKVSCVPDIYDISGLQPGTLLILACDGLWGVMPSEVVGAIVKDRLQQNPDADLGDIAAAIVHLSRGLGSKDNITVMIAQLAQGASVQDLSKESVVELEDTFSLLKQGSCLAEPLLGL